MLLAFDVGNTNIVLGVFKGKKLIHMARILGAPDTVPAGRVDFSASSAVNSGKSCPLTTLVRCIT